MAGLEEVPIISNKTIDKINIVHLKTSAQIPFRVGRITMPKNTSNIDKFPILLTSDRQGKGTLEVKINL